MPLLGVVQGEGVPDGQAKVCGSDGALLLRGEK